MDNDLNGVGQEDYKKFLETIRRNMDPDSNTVLVVDDDKGIRRKVIRDIAKFDRDIVPFEASNGSEALDVLARIRKKYYRDPLFMVLDLNMPIMDGWSVIRNLKKEYTDSGKQTGIPIIVLSSTSGEKGAVFRKQSVHDGKTGYQPLVSVAKENCVDGARYDASGDRGLIEWLQYFVKA